MGTHVIVPFKALRLGNGIQQATTSTEEMEFTLQAAGDSRIVSYVLLASIAWLLYDTCLTFSEEVTIRMKLP
jgi:hypothetical protein